MAQQPSPQQIRTWINRQRTLANPSPLYIEWLRKQFRITATANVIRPKSVDYLQYNINILTKEETVCQDITQKAS